MRLRRKSKNCPATYSVVGDVRTTWRCLLDPEHEGAHIAKDGYEWGAKSGFEDKLVDARREVLGTGKVVLDLPDGGSIEIRYSGNPTLPQAAETRTNRKEA